MTLQMREHEKYEEGITRGEDLLSMLISRLFADGREKDAKLVVTDKEARENLYREYGLRD